MFLGRMALPESVQRTCIRDRYSGHTIPTGYSCSEGQTLTLVVGLPLTSPRRDAGRVAAQAIPVHFYTLLLRTVSYT